MKSWNQLKTLFLLAMLTAIFMAVGRALGGQNGMLMGLVFAAVTNFGAYWFSDKIVLKMYGAKPLTAEGAPELYGIVERLAQKQNLPMPALYLIPEALPNAFATGRNPQHAAMAVTQGLLDVLSVAEVEGVLGHELGHIKNRDTLVSTIAATLAGALSMLSQWAMWGGLGRHRDEDGDRNPLFAIVGIILAPFAAMLIQTAISRSREFMADETGAQVTGDPLMLASALKKIEGASRMGEWHRGTPATGHLFILNPFRGASLMKWMSTHPPTAERVKRLEAMAGQPFKPALHG